jgi:hypothetical protein
VSDCPACAYCDGVDLADVGHLTIPAIGEPTPVYHLCKRCGHDWATWVVVRVSLELHTQQQE